LIGVFPARHNNVMHVAFGFVFPVTAKLQRLLEELQNAFS
jgi:hypothetical protein